MTIANVNIGTGPSSGDGDPIRSAFNIVNENFTQLAACVGVLSNSVTSVAGRSGNVFLTTADITGISNYATITYVDDKISYANTTPTPTSTGSKGDIVQDGQYIYFCIAANTWIRSSITTSW